MLVKTLVRIPHKGKIHPVGTVLDFNPQMAKALILSRRAASYVEPDKKSAPKSASKKSTKTSKIEDTKVFSSIETKLEKPEPDIVKETEASSQAEGDKKEESEAN